MSSLHTKRERSSSARLRRALGAQTTAEVIRVESASICDSQRPHSLSSTRQRSDAWRSERSPRSRWATNVPGSPPESSDRSNGQSLSPTRRLEFAQEETDSSDGATVDAGADLPTSVVHEDTHPSCSHGAMEYTIPEGYGWEATQHTDPNAALHEAKTTKPQFILTPSRDALWMLTPSRTRIVPAADPEITCNHHAPRCPISTCMKCSRCGCEHDGVSLEEKARRPPGRPRKVKGNPRGLVVERKTRHSKRSIKIATPSPTPEKNVLPGYVQILRTLNLSKGSVAYWQKHMPSGTRLSEEAYWSNDGTLDPQTRGEQSIVFNFYKEVLDAVSRSLCGCAGPLSLQKFLQWSQDRVRGVGERPLDLTVALQAIQASRKGSIERRVLRASLCSLFTRKEVLATAAPMQNFTLSNDSFARSRQDMEVLVDAGSLPVIKWQRQKFKPVVVDGAISAILSAANVSYLSWGTKTLIVDGVARDVPAVLRRRPVSAMYDSYCASHPAPDRIGRWAFYRLCDFMTHGEMQTRTSVDYVTGNLIYDTFDTLLEIIESVAPDQVEEYKTKLEATRAWLKYGHPSISQDTVCPRHDIEYGLSLPVPNKPEQREVCCGPCWSIQKLFEDITTLVVSSDHDPTTPGVIRDIHHKVQLYLGHRVRVANQQLQIERMMTEMKEACEKTQVFDAAWIVIDFKMKAEPLYFREKTSDHFGKRGMSWHRVMAHYWEKNDNEDNGGNAVVDSRLYYDHIASTDNCQDKGAVLAMLEAMMIALKRDQPSISRITVQSDNASYYQNACVMLLLPIIGAAHGIRVERFVHTETQDGKSQLDAHFGQCSRKVRRYVKQGNNCVTPAQLAIGLTSDNGLANSVAELVHYDRAALSNLMKMFEYLEKQFGKLAERTNEAVYDFPVQNLNTDGDFDLSKCPDFSVRLYTYSSIGSGHWIDVFPSRDSCVRRTAQPHDTETGEGNEDDDDEICGRDSNDDDIESVTDEEMGEEASLDTFDDVIDPVVSVGYLTKVTITRTSQLRRRQRKWRVFGGQGTSKSKSNSEAKAQTSDNIISYAKRQFYAMSSKIDFQVIDPSGLTAKIIGCAGVHSPRSQQSPGRFLLFRGWARRPGKGLMYGAKYLDKYRDEIQELFGLGAEDSSRKMGAGRMLEILRLRYPRRFNLPTESEIKAEISRLFTLSKKRANVGDTNPRRSKKNEATHSNHRGVDINSCPQAQHPTERSSKRAAEEVQPD